MASAAAPMYHTVSVGAQTVYERHEARNHMGERETLETCVHKIAIADGRCCSPDRGRSARVSLLVMLMRHHRGRLVSLSDQLNDCHAGIASGGLRRRHPRLTSAIA
jgi:hypothetical protein